MVNLLLGMNLPKMRSILFITPLDKVNEGIELCLQNAFQYIEEAELLLGKGRGNHALGLLVLAAEEAGKAKLLLIKRDAARSTSEFINYVQFAPENKKPNPFYSHKEKLNAIAVDIAIDEVIAWLKGHEKAPASDYVVTFINAVTKLREAVFYVDYDMQSKDWLWITKVDDKKLSHLIDDVEDAIRYLRKKI
jgi:AbiV family abortive infection protein